MGMVIGMASGTLMDINAFKEGRQLDRTKLLNCLLLHLFACQHQLEISFKRVYSVNILI